MIAPRPDIAFDRTCWWPLPTSSCLALSLCPETNFSITSALCRSRRQSAAAADGATVTCHLMRVPCVKEWCKTAVWLTHGAGMMPAGTHDSPPSITKLIKKHTSARHVHQSTAQLYAHHVGLIGAGVVTCICACMELLGLLCHRGRSRKHYKTGLHADYATHAGSAATPDLHTCSVPSEPLLRSS